MFKIIGIISITAVILSAQTYKSILEPYNTYTISSEVTGMITKLDLSKELKEQNGIVIEIENTLDKKQLVTLNNKYKYLKKLLEIKKENSKTIYKLSGRSLREKENSLIDILNTNIQLSDIKYSINKLKETLRKKTIRLDKIYLKKFLVHKGEFVTQGKELLIAEDQSKTRIVIYIDKSDLRDISKIKVFLNGSEEVGYSIDKIANSSDATYLSLYRVELVKEGPSLFGSLVTIKINGKEN